MNAAAGPTTTRRHITRSWAIAIAAAAIVVGVGLGALVTWPSVSDARHARRDADAELERVRQQRDAAEGDATILRAQAQSVTKKESDLAAREAAVAQREQAITQLQAAIDKNSFGDGVFEVGVDIQPGKYKTGGGVDCYWAKLRADDSIIANDLPHGPTTVTIESSASKFQSKSCGTWLRSQ